MKQLIKIFKFALLLACSVYIVIFFSTNKEDLRLILNIHVCPLIFLCCLSVLYQFIHGYRFKVVLNKCSKSNLPFWDWLKIFMQTRFLNLIFPQFGNIYRSMTLKKNYNISYTNYISTFTSFAWMDTCFNLIFATIIILLFEPTLKILCLNAGFLLIGLSFVIIFLPILSLKILRKTKINFPKIVWIQSKLREVLYTSLANLRDIKYISSIIILGFLILLRTILFYYILFYSFGIRPSLSILIIFYVLFKFSSFVVITPGNLGIQEIAFGFLSSQLGIGMSKGILVCAVGRVISTSVILLLGIFFGGIGLLQHRKDYSKNDIKK